MSAQIAHVGSVEQSSSNFLLLKHKPIFTIALYSTAPQEADARAFIANGRFVSANEVEVWVLDGSDLAECVRTESGLHFEVEVSEGHALRGFAFSRSGESRMGSHDRRYVEARLSLDTATVELTEYAPVKWLT